MKIRRAVSNDLGAILRLYAYLQPSDPKLDANEPTVARHWEEIIADDRRRYYVAEANGAIVSTCTLSLIPNLTRQMRPYGLIENVVTDPTFQKKGFASAVLRHALNEAWAEGCYKVMLLSGRKEEATLRFYEGVGFHRGIKTGFIAYPTEIRGVS